MEVAGLVERRGRRDGTRKRGGVAGCDGIALGKACESRRCETLG